MNMFFLTFFLPRIVLLLIIGLFLFLPNPGRYIPIVTITASTDGGKMYTNRLNAIPANQDVYIKCEVRVKANGLLQFFGHTVDFDIESPQPFYSIEHTDIIESNKTTHGDSECSKRFSIIAAKKPVKAELILKFRSGCSDTKKPFTIKFRYPVQRLHKKILF